MLSSNQFVYPDSGASQNFVASTFVQLLQENPDEIALVKLVDSVQNLATPLIVNVADGQDIVAHQSVDLQIWFDEEAVVLRCYILDQIAENLSKKVIIGKPLLRVLGYSLNMEKGETVTFHSSSKDTVRPKDSFHQLRSTKESVAPYKVQLRNYPYSSTTKPYPVNPKILQDYINEALATNLIRPLRPGEEDDHIAFAPIFPIKEIKSNGEEVYRWVYDLRQINSHLLYSNLWFKDLRFVLSQIAKYPWLSVLDISKAFHSVDLDPNGDKIGIVTQEGHFIISKLPFGLASSSSVFNSRLSSILSKVKLSNGIVISYVDDIVIGSTTELDGEKNLEVVLNALKDADLIINPKKIQRNQPTIRFLGQIVGQGRLEIPPEKQAKLKEWPIPTDVSTLRSYLGFINYNRDKIQNFALVTADLYHFLKKGVVFDKDKVAVAFQACQDVVVQSNLIGMWRIDQLVILHVDASLAGYGGVAYQADTQGSLRVVSFISGRFSDTESSYGITDRELLSLVKVLESDKRFKLSKLLVLTDHQPLISSRHKSSLTTRALRLWNRLYDFNFEINYIKGELNHADALSRWFTTTDNEVTASVLKNSSFNGCFNSALAASNDPPGAPENPAGLTAASINYMLEHFGNLPEDWKLFVQKYVLLDDDVYIRFPAGLMKYLTDEETRLYLETFHSKFHGSIRLIKEHFQDQGLFSPNLPLISTEVVALCPRCELFASWSQIPAELQSMKLAMVGQIWHLDYVEIRQGSQQNYTYCLNAVEYVSGLLISLPATNMSSLQVYQMLLFIKQIAPNMSETVMDNAAYFTSGALKQMLNHFNINFHYSSNYQPASNGSVERRNGLLKKLLLALTPNFLNWERFLPKAVMMLNAQKSVMNFSPYYLYTGIQVSSEEFQKLTDIDVDSPITEENKDNKPLSLYKLESITKRISSLEMLLHDREINISKKHRLRKLRQLLVNRTANHSYFNIGDWVLKRRIKRSKMESYNEGPFMVKKVYDKNAYVLQRSDGTELKGSYNINQLKPAFVYYGSPLRSISDVLKSHNLNERKYLKNVVEIIDREIGKDIENHAEEVVNEERN